MAADSLESVPDLEQHVTDPMQMTGVPTDFDSVLNQFPEVIKDLVHKLSHQAWVHIRDVLRLHFNGTFETRAEILETFWEKQQDREVINLFTTAANGHLIDPFLAEKELSATANIFQDDKVLAKSMTENNQGDEEFPPPPPLRTI